MKKILVVGLGNMGLPIYTSLKKNVNFEVKGFDPFQKNIPDLETDLKKATSNAEIIILAVKPDKILEVIEKFTVERKIISIAAGISLSTIEKKNYYGSKLVRLMPNLPLQISKGCMGYYGDKEIYSDVIEIFTDLGLLIELQNENLIDSFTALAGSGPAFVFSFVQSLAEGGVKSGLSYNDALKISIQTILGSTEFLQKEYEEKKSHPMDLRNKVTSAGGTTIFGLSEWEKNGTSFGISESVYQAKLRSDELKKISK